MKTRPQPATRPRRVPRQLGSSLPDRDHGSPRPQFSLSLEGLLAGRLYLTPERSGPRGEPKSPPTPVRCSIAIHAPPFASSSSRASARLARSTHAVTVSGWWSRAGGRPAPWPRRCPLPWVDLKLDKGGCRPILGSAIARITPFMRVVWAEQETLNFHNRPTSDAAATTLPATIERAATPAAVPAMIAAERFFT